MGDADGGTSPSSHTDQLSSVPTCDAKLRGYRSSLLASPGDYPRNGSPLPHNGNDGITGDNGRTPPKQYSLLFLGGAGGSIRDHMGCWVREYSAKLNVSSPLEDELSSLFCGLLLARSMQGSSPKPEEPPAEA
ncbi:hypothetical protein FXO37_26275 [Capsicum annuum]|nr:hypothetical protein FXO37_26275 [Capsicum annuum]